MYASVEECHCQPAASTVDHSVAVQKPHLILLKLQYLSGPCRDEYDDTIQSLTTHDVCPARVRRKRVVNACGNRREKIGLRASQMHRVLF
jgi:hypothetical protein